MTLELSYERCVRTRSVEARCQVCVDVCPTRAITLEGPKRSVEVALDDCTGCGLCEAACPTEAFSGTRRVDAVRATATVACGEDGLSCVGSISGEELVVLALKAPFELAAKTCPSGWTGHARAEAAVREANAFLGALGLSQRITWSDDSSCNPPSKKVAHAPVPARREFIGLFVPRAVPARGPMLRMPERINARLLREGTATRRRHRLLAALPSSVHPAVATLPDDTIGFTSSKTIDAATCTGCMACVTACPTSSLTTSRLRDVVRFDSSRCTRCGLCHDVCEPGSLTLSPQFEVAGFLDFSIKPLVKLAVSQCGECGAFFKTDGEVLCPRCSAHDGEARELWGVK